MAIDRRPCMNAQEREEDPDERIAFRCWNPDVVWNATPWIWMAWRTRPDLFRQPHGKRGPARV